MSKTISEAGSSAFTLLRHCTSWALNLTPETLFIAEALGLTCRICPVMQSPHLQATYSLMESRSRNTRVTDWAIINIYWAELIYQLESSYSVPLKISLIFKVTLKPYSSRMSSLILPWQAGSVLDSDHGKVHSLTQTCDLLKLS